MWPIKVQPYLWRATGRSISCTVIVNVNHYDVLGLTPKATQAEVKAAYYKMSKLHHPDTRDNESEGSDKFRLITEAYEVLGNYKSRQLYDRGLYGHGSIGQESRSVTPDDPKAAFYRARFNKERVPVRGQKNIYNFDEWTRQHYSESLGKSKLYKSFGTPTNRGRHGAQSMADNQGEFPSAYLILALFVMGITLYSMSRDGQFDTPHLVRPAGERVVITSREKSDELEGK